MTVDIAKLRQFAPLARLSDEQLILLSARMTSRRVDAGSMVMESGSRDNLVYFLMQGCLTLQALDGEVTRVEEGSDAARHAIALLQPRQYTVRAERESDLAILELPLLTRLVKEAPGKSAPIAAATESDMDSPSFSLLMQFHQDLRSNQVSLPSLPDVAVRIRQVAEREHSSMADIARVIRNDPAMTVKLLRAANSPFYRGWSSIETCEDAIVRLGLKTTRQLITIFALRELFKTRTPHLKERMVKLWDHSREVAAISYVLAKMTPGMNPEHAMLAGLIHQVGAIPVIMYAEKQLSLVKYPEMLEEVIAELRGEVGVALLEQWGFAADLVEVVMHADDFMYDSGSDAPHYVDVLLIARIHAAIGKRERLEVPSMEAVPAFRKLALGELTADRSLKVLAEAQQELSEARAMVSGG